MVRLQDFDLISYSRPRFFPDEKPLDNIIGFDSEAYQDGSTFMFCTSEGDVIPPEHLIDFLFDNYSKTNFVTWNLKYESGAILKLFPREIIKSLQLFHKTELVYNKKKYKLSYVPHKKLTIHHVAFAGVSIHFWDMSPFYGRCRLGDASETYLKESKEEADVKSFSPEYVKIHYDEISRYCIKDALLTKNLSLLWIDKFQQTGVPVTSLYSEASISFSYISRKTEIVTPFEYWDTNKKLMRLAFESYEGGKFEILKRGSFQGTEYDISSAYPYEIANLIDIRDSEVVYSRAYIKEAVYAFLRVHIKLTNPDVRLPCGIFRTKRLYPMGEYYLTITKQEYDYITTEITVRGLSIEILDGAWLVVRKVKYPYKEVISELYALKSKWKPKDRLRSNNYKIIMNGFYGKMAQCISALDGTYKAGRGWNPLYASIITANTRIAVTRLQNLLGRDCLAVHTDSVIVTKTIPDRFLGIGLGMFEKVEEGPCTLIACGIYEIAGVSALKGFKKYSVTSILRENPGVMKIKVKIEDFVQSWLMVMAQNHNVSDINVFKDLLKALKLNCDTKRIWPFPMTSDQFLNSLQSSYPLTEQQDKKPLYWKE